MLLGLTYAMIGAILAPLVGRVAGVLVAFLIPFLDLGIAQDPMLHAAPPTWARFLPGYGAVRVLTNSILTHGPGSPGPLLAALAWLTGLTVAAAWRSATTWGPRTPAHRHVTGRGPAFRQPRAGPPVTAAR